MKKTILLLALFMGTYTVQAQSFKDKIKAAKEAAEKKYENIQKANAGYMPTFSTEVSQHEIAKLWSDNEYVKYRILTTTNQGSEINVKFIEGSDGYINKLIVDEEPYRLIGFEGGIGFGECWYGEWNHEYIILDSTMIVMYFSDNGGKNCTVVRGGINKSALKTEDQINAALDEYLPKAEAKNTEIRKAASEKAAGERLAKYGLADKDVVSVEVKVKAVSDLKGNTSKGQFGRVGYEIITTLKDGTKISTNDGGYSSDYYFSYPHAQYDGLSIKPEFSTKDVMQIDVDLIKDPSIKASGSYVLDYDYPFSIDWSAYGGGTIRGESATDVNIYIKQTTNTENGDKLLMVRMERVSTGEIVEFKVKSENKFGIFVYGGDGGVSRDGAPYNGGNGGNITVYVDPNVESYNLVHANDGGDGGKTAYNSGRDGRDGSFTEVIKDVNF